MPHLPAWITAGAIALGSTLALPALAQQITVTNVAVPAWDQGVDISYGNLTYNGVIAGQIDLHASYAGAIASPAFDVYAWCVDLFHDIYLGAHTYNYILASAVTTDGNGGAVSSATSSELLTLASYGNTRLAGPDAGNADVSTAIQLAIWQTEYPGFTFVANSTVTSDVAAFEAYAAANPLGGTSLVSLDGAQALITSPLQPTTTGNSDVPEPVSALLLAGGLAGLAWARRRG